MAKKEPQICKMCHEEKILCRAHIWPEGLKNILNDEDNHFISASSKTGYGTKIQTLEFDPNILCAECDGTLGNYDKVLIRTIKKYFNHPLRQEPFKEGKKINAIVTLSLTTYKFKLGIAASYLRMSFSSRFPSINLGRKYTNMLISWLKNGNIPEEEDKHFDIMMIGYSADEAGLDKIIISCPMNGKQNHSHYYFQEFLLGLTLTIKIGKGIWAPQIGKYPKITAQKDTLEVPLCDPTKAFSMRLLADVRKAIDIKS